MPPLLEALKKAANELGGLCGSWGSPVWNELDWERVKELQVREILTEREVRIKTIESSECLRCPNFLKHVSCGTIIPLSSGEG
jgi:antiviral helicase SKI2